MMHMPMDKWADYWADARPHIDAACQHGDLTVEHMEEHLATGEYQLIVLDGGASIINIEDESLHITAVGGKFDYEWIDGFLDYVAAIAITMGRRKLTGCGRKGWLRRLRYRGWELVDGHFEVSL